LIDVAPEVVGSWRRDRNAALRLLKSLMKKYDYPLAIVPDNLRSHGAAMKAIGNAARQECDGQWINNRTENSYQPFRRRGRAMHRFRRTSTLQKFTSVHAALHNHFNLERHLVDRNTDRAKSRRPPMLAWRQIDPAGPVNLSASRPVAAPAPTGQP
jgi:putative transposase